jgi:hypothetical protein
MAVLIRIPGNSGQGEQGGSGIVVRVRKGRVELTCLDDRRSVGDMTGFVDGGACAVVRVERVHIHGRVDARRKVGRGWKVDLLLHWSDRD